MSGIDDEIGAAQGVRRGERRGVWRGIERNVLITGIVSLLTDASSELIYPILPLYLANVLGAGAVTIGLIEGIAESTASLLKVGSGWLSDRAGRRKPLMVLGYGLSDLIKPLLCLTNSWTQVLAIRFGDRVGKGVRGAPRDALIADDTPAAYRGKAFGFHRALDTIGAAIGPLAAFAILTAFHNNFRLVFLLSAIPGVPAVLVLLLLLRERRAAPRHATRPRADLRALGPGFFLFVAVATVFSLGNSSDAFLILRAQDLGLSVALVPLAYLVFNLVYAALAMPLGGLSDRVSRRLVIVGGFVVFSAVYLGFGLIHRSSLVWGLFALYGVYYALTDGVQRAYIADLVPSHLRASAIGIFNASVGFAMLPASIVGGVLWRSFTPAATFQYGAALSLLAAVLMLAVPMGQSRRLPA